MKLLLDLVVPGDPIPWKRAGRRGGATYTPPDVRRAEETIRWLAKDAGASPVDGDVTVEVIFYRRTGQRCDLDNLLKLVLDALNGFAWIDDSQVVSILAEKTVDAANPRTELRVWRKKNAATSENGNSDRR